MKKVVDFPVFKEITYPNIKPNSYLISEYGHVYNKEESRFMYGFLNSYRYLQIRLLTGVDNPKYTLPLISRLVAYEFCNNPDLNLTVDHLDGNTLNNHYSNLEWVTIQTNMRRKYIDNRSNYQYIKYDDQINTLCGILQNNPTITYSEACKLSGLYLNDNQSKGLCCDIIDRKYWTNISSNYDFSNRSRKRVFTDDDKKNMLRILNTYGENELFKYLYNKDISMSTRKEKDNFVHIIKRLIIWGSSTNS